MNQNKLYFACSLIKRKLKVPSVFIKFYLLSFTFFLFIAGCTQQTPEDKDSGEALTYKKPFRLNTGKTVESSPLSRGQSQMGNYADPLFIEHDTSILHQAIQTETWDILALLEYKREYINGTPWYVPKFAQEILALEGTQIELKGYMIPLDPGRNHDNFLISVLPLLQCHFCGQGGIPEMVEVFSRSTLRYTERIIYVKGTLRLNNSDPNHFTFILEDADLL